MAAVATQAPKVSKNGREVEKISVAWTSDASGNASVLIEKMFGYLLKLVTDPTDGPTASYDITLIDENGVDALAGAGADRHTTNTEQVYPTATGSTVPVFLCGDHTFTVANAGNAKSGVAIFYIVESL